MMEDWEKQRALWLARANVAETGDHIQSALVLALGIVREDSTLTPDTHYAINQLIQHLQIASSAPDALRVEEASCR